MSKSQPVSRLPIQGWPAILFGAPFAGVGVYVLLCAVGVVHIPASSVHAPMWIIGVVGGVFAACGLLCMGHGADGLRRRHRAAQRARLHPDQPWLTEHAWDPAGTRDRTTAIGLELLGFAVLLGMLSVGHWFAFSVGGLSGIFVKVLVGAFDLVMLLVLSATVKRIVQRLKHGRSRLAFNTFPFFSGREIDVTLIGPRGLVQAETLTGTLRCLQEAYVDTGTGEDRRTVVVCEVLYAADVEIDPRGSLVVRIPLADDAPGTDLGRRPARFWELRIAAVGLGYESRFILPVYRRAA